MAQFTFSPGTMTTTPIRVLRPLQPVRLAADVDRQTAERLDAIAAQHQTTRAAVIREAIRHALELATVQEAG